MSMVMRSFVCVTDCQGENIFKCDNGKCMPDTVQCDGHDDCGDGSDEIGCGKSSLFI
jgi:hypothetical protein